MRRLYSTFAGGWPGLGLFLLRFAVGFALIVPATSTLLRDPATQTTITSAFLAGCGILLILGLWTPIVSLVVLPIEIWQGIATTGERPVPLLLATIGCALAMLGPGLWSLDARLFGWKRVEPPPRKNSYKPS